MFEANILNALTCAPVILSFYLRSFVWI